MKSFRRVIFIALVALAISTSAQAQSPAAVDADSATTAWANIEKGMPALFPPPEWRMQPPKPEEVAAFQKKLIESARAQAGKARDFLKRYPTNENAGEARFMVVYALSHAVAAGDASAEKEARDFVEATMKDPAIAEDDKAKVFMLSSTIDLMKRLGMRFFVEGQQKFGDEMDKTMTEGLLNARKQFPTNEFIFTGLIAVAERSKRDEQKRLADEVLNSPGAPPGAKAFAQHLKNGTRPYQVGKPLDFRFTALDGREVDLAKLKGKVVLVEFWATDCGPCVAEMPNVKATYEKFHADGFEVIAIDLDEKESALRKFVKEKELPWPQYFDGKGWSNKFAVQYGIFGIPTMWLVDKQGNLRDPNARGRLDEIISGLLHE